jgi:hypothetical protein
MYYVSVNFFSGAPCDAYHTSMYMPAAVACGRRDCNPHRRSYTAARTEQNRTELETRSRYKHRFCHNIWARGKKHKTRGFDFDLSLKGRLKTPENRREI